MTTPTYRSAKLTQVDSRRLPGKNLFFDGPGVILDIAGPPDQVAGVVALWQRHVKQWLAAVGWPDAPIASRVFGSEGNCGANVAFAAPLDALLAATDVNEAAFASATAELERPGGDQTDILIQTQNVGFVTSSASASHFDVRCLDQIVGLRQKIAAERAPRLVELRVACAARGIAFVFDDDVVSIGIGAGSRSWKRGELPDLLDVAAIDWSGVRDVPVAMVTGTNGKSTTVRLLAAMVRAAGKVAGMSTTDWVKVGDELLDRGDYSGPSGARMVLRDRRVDVALLETARGGMLRRGLAIGRVDAALVTNVTPDHLGEFGVASMDDLVDAKLIVRRAVDANGRLVLNAEDPLLVARAPQLTQPLAWFALDPRNALLRAHVERGGDGATVEAREGFGSALSSGCASDGAQFVLYRGGQRTVIAPVVDVPITLRGAAKHNVANVLAALLVASRLSLGDAALAAGLRAFKGTPDENPGRLNVIELGGVTAIVDFAHNPDGIRVVMEMAAALSAKRRLLVIGQAGDRDDDSIRAYAAAAAPFRPDCIVIKEMANYLRGREPGVIPALLADEFVRCGIARDRIDHAPSEFAAVERALEWARAGDLLILLSHAERAKVLAHLAELQRVGWCPAG
ncbi:MAG: Mur ligase [Planctomycetes bacterium]|nr:Mur ligase [Planctomycetota bacterium]